MRAFAYTGTVCKDHRVIPSEIYGAKRPSSGGRNWPSAVALTLGCENVVPGTQVEFYVHARDGTTYSAALTDAQGSPPPDLFLTVSDSELWV